MPQRLDLSNNAHGRIDLAIIGERNIVLKKKFKWLILASSAFIISFGGIAAFDNYQQIKSTQAEIQHLETERQQLHEQQEQLKNQNTEKQEELDQKSQQIEDLKNNEEKLKQEIERLKVAKAERERKRLALLASQKASAAPAASFGGNCDSWIAAAGISDTGNARELIRRESGCDPYARNPSSGACGVAQELPCGKSGCSIGDGACQVHWMNSYVISRYGSWSAAVAFHNANNWY